MSDHCESHPVKWFSSEPKQRESARASESDAAWTVHGLKIKTAIKAGTFVTSNRGDQPDPANPRTRRGRRGPTLTSANFGVNDRGELTFRRDR